MRFGGGSLLLPRCRGSGILTYFGTRGKWKEGGRKRISTVLRCWALAKIQYAIGDL